MALGIKIKCPYPLSLEGAGLPNAFVSLQNYYLECKITPSNNPHCAIHKNKSQRSLASFLTSQIEDNIKLYSHDLTIDLKHAGVNNEILYAAILSTLKYANHFFERKGHPIPFRIPEIPLFPPDLFFAGKFAFLSGSSIRHLPYPSGLVFSLYRHSDTINKIATKDENAFALSSSLFRMEYNDLNLISIPESITSPFKEYSDCYLCLLPIVETQEIMAVFSNSSQQEEFQRKLDKLYISSIELDLDGIIVI